jgi:hypothetical protein
MPAIATKTLPTPEGPDRRVEISVTAAEDLFREIRIENRFTDVVGTPVSVSAGVRFQLTLEAEPGDEVTGP